jgi:uncharacterized membrane protein
METKKTFDGDLALKTGWNGVKSNIGLFIPLLIVVLIATIGANFFAETLKEKIWLRLVYQIFYLAFSVLVTLGFTRIYLNIIDGVAPKFQDFFKSTGMFLEAFIANIFIWLVAFLVTIVFLIPVWFLAKAHQGLATIFFISLGVIILLYLNIRWGFFMYFIVDKEAGPISALSESWKLTKGLTWKLLLFGLAIIGVNTIGILCLLIGLFITVPLSALAITHIYRQLVNQIPVQPSTAN